MRVPDLLRQNPVFTSLHLKSPARVVPPREISNTGSKNWLLPKEMNANRCFWDSYWLKIWSNHLCPSKGPNGVSVAMDSEISRSCRTASGKVVVHSNPPYAMAWTAQHICVAGPDKKVVFYTQEGLLAQQFDYFRCNFNFILLEQQFVGWAANLKFIKLLTEGNLCILYFYFILTIRLPFFTVRVFSSMYVEETAS
jgi:hypothetical protein